MRPFSPHQPHRHHHPGMSHNPAWSKRVVQPIDDIPGRRTTTPDDAPPPIRNRPKGWMTPPLPPRRSNKQRHQHAPRAQYARKTSKSSMADPTSVPRTPVRWRTGNDPVIVIASRRTHPGVICQTKIAPHQDVAEGREDAHDDGVGLLRDISSSTTCEALPDSACGGGGESPPAAMPARRKEVRQRPHIDAAVRSAFRVSEFSMHAHGQLGWPPEHHRFLAFGGFPPMLCHDTRAVHARRVSSGI